MKLQKNFLEGKMNKDVDERLLPEGQYRHAENIRVANSEGSDVGAIENILGNEALIQIQLTNPKTIGKLTDSSNRKIYYFITSIEKDLIIEWDNENLVWETVLESSNPNGVLNFDRNSIITGVDKIINGKSEKDLLAWTDNINPPRIIVIDDAKEYAADGFNNDDISVIKKPPRFAPNVTLTYTDSTLENNLENKFISVAYRYKYKGGFYSALSSFTYYKFSPSEFELDYQTMENNGMVNNFNALNIEFDSGSDKVTDVELVYKESGSNALYLIEKFNKEEQGWSDNSPQSFVFSNSKLYKILPQDELFRTYDNVPLTAKAQSVIGSRLAYGNYVEGYDMVNEDGDSVKNDYDLSIVSEELVSNQITSTGYGTVRTYDFEGVELSEGKVLIFEVVLTEMLDHVHTLGKYRGSFQFILNRDYVDADDLATDPSFVLFIESVWTTDFYANYTNTPPNNSIIIDPNDPSRPTKFTIALSTSSEIQIVSPYIVYKVDDTPSNPSDNMFHEETSMWIHTSESNAFIKDLSSAYSVKSNRSYEAGLIYMDGEGRKTTVETTPENTIFVPSNLANYKNSIQVDINHKPPVWADRYKIAIKQSKGEYQTIYANIFYEDGVYRWVKLEGANKNKVKEGDTLIVKSDLGGVRSDLIKVRVLEVGLKEKNFIEDNETENGEEIIEEAGLYMKIKPAGFDISYTGSTADVFEGSDHLRYPVRTYTQPSFPTPNADTPRVLKAGSSVRIYIKTEGRGNISYVGTYDRTFRVNSDYDTVEDWFNAEVGNLGQFGRDYTWDGVSHMHNGGLYGYGIGDINHKTSGWGFENGRFYVMAHRDGTASRNITTTVKFEIMFSEGTVIFETEPDDVNDDIYYETEETFEIINGNHQGNVQNQNGVSTPAIVKLGFFNCYVFSNGAECYRYKDIFNSNALSIDLRPTSTSIERYSRVNRYAEITYSEPYIESTSVNGLNEFNLSRGNYKDDIEKKYGSIQLMYSRDTDIVVFQEDKVSKVLYDKDLLFNADGTTNLSSVDYVLGQQVMYSGEYGISNNPESFIFNGNNLYFSDLKRGCILRLSANGITEISMYGMRTWFKDRFRDNPDAKVIGAFDPFYDQYVVTIENSNSYEVDVDNYTLTFDENVKGWTSFHSFVPNQMVGMNNEFFSMKGGNLYKHHIGDRNTFYGVTYPSKIDFIFNNAPFDIKAFKTLNLEGTHPWQTAVITNLTYGNVHLNEFVNKEDEWYAYIRRAEDTSDYSSIAVQGVGSTLGATSINTISFSQKVNGSLSNGDSIYKVDGDNLILLGEVQSHSDTSITLVSFNSSVNIGDFIVFSKNVRAEASMIRGYYMLVKMINDSTDKVELFAVNSEVFKSYE